WSMRPHMSQGNDTLSLGKNRPCKDSILQQCEPFVSNLTRSNARAVEDLLGRGAADLPLAVKGQLDLVRCNGLPLLRDVRRLVPRITRCRWATSPQLIEIERSSRWRQTMNELEIFTDA